jgi:hypothetical protein
MKKIILTSIMALTLMGCGNASVKESEPVDIAVMGGDAEPASADTPPTPTVPPKPVFAWTYTDKTDQMRGTTEKFAMLSSSDLVRTNWPYNQSPMRLTIRRRATDGVNVMLHINGQFLCNEYSGNTYVTVKFDDGALEKFRCIEGGGGGNDVIFIEPETRFISRIKASKVMMLEAAVYDIGRTQVSFNVEGLEWE